MFDFLGYGFVDLSMIGIIIIGILIGIEHAFEIDHVVAVSTLVSQKKIPPPMEYRRICEYSCRFITYNRIYLNKISQWRTPLVEGGPIL